MRKISIVIVDNLDDYKFLLQSGFNFSGKSILTSSIEVTQQCLVNDHEFINIWKYLDDTVIEQSEYETIKLTESFTISNTVTPVYLGVPYFDTTKIYMRYFFKAALHTLHVLEKLLTEFEITEAYIRHNKTQSINVIQYERSHILDGVAEYFFEKKNVVIHHITIGSPTVNIESIPPRYNPDDFPFKKENYLCKDKKTVLFILSENFEWDFDLVRFIRENENLNICIVWRIPHITTVNKPSEKWLPLFFSDFAVEDDRLRCEHRNIDSIEKGFLHPPSDIHSLPAEIFSNSHLEFQFSDLFNRLKAYTTDIHTFDKICDFIQPDIVYFSNSWDMSVRCMIQRARLRGYTTFTSIHGGVVDNAGYITRALDTDNYLVWGEDNRQGFVSAGQDPDTIKTVGSVQMEFWNAKVQNVLSENKQPLVVEHTKYFRDNYDASQDEKRPFTVTYFTSIGGGFSGHSIQEYYHLDTLKNIVILAKKFPAICFRVKPHILFDYDEFWKQYGENEEIPENFEIIPKQDLLKACLETDIGILVNTISNVAYEISLAGKPVIFLKDACFKAHCAESTLERGGILCLDSVDELERFLLRYMEDASLKVELETSRLQFLDHALMPFTETVFKRIEALFLKAKKNNPIASNSDLFKIICWVHDAVRDPSGPKPFPQIEYAEKFPRGKELIDWLYNITLMRTQYYSRDPAIVFSGIVKAIPSLYGVSAIQKARRLIYNIARKYYLKNRLNENTLVRSLLKK